MKNQRKLKLVLFSIGILVFCMFGLGCGQAKVDEDKSPALETASITSYNEGSESKQYVKVTLNFDQDISVPDKLNDSLRITIAKERVQSDEYTITQGENANQAELTISVNAVTTGVLEIEKSEKADTISDIRDASGTYAVKDFTLEGTIPSGVTLSDVAVTDNSVTKQVDSAWNIRSIAWVCLTKDGEVIPVNESDVNEELDGHVAVHGHEFLTEDDGVIAEKIVEALDRVYGDEYQFSSDKNRITATAVNGESGVYDIEIYQYLKINGETVRAEDTHSEEDGEHELGSKIKASDYDREPTAEELTFINKLHITQNSDEIIKDGSEWYSVLTVTGDAMPEEEIYSVRDLEELIQLSFMNQSMNQLGLSEKVTVSLNGNPQQTYYGINLLKFLELCGVDMNQTSLYLVTEQADGSSKTVNLAEAISADADLLLVFADETGPLSKDGKVLAGPMGCIWTSSETGKSVQSAGNIKKLTVSSDPAGTDPEYKYHNREPFTDSLNKTFTVEVYQRGGEYLGALTTKTFTTAEFEQLMKNYPEQVVGNYYGTIGNAEIFPYMGAGGWLDYYEGIDLRWLLTEQVGIETLSGSAELVGRDGAVYGTIDDLNYLTSYESEDYYVLSTDGVRIPNAVPMIACTKNGYPILPEHDHESSGYIAYNAMNAHLEKAGIETEVGVVKNHSGPFIACLGNADTLYGGNQVETGGDCILMKIYLE